MLFINGEYTKNVIHKRSFLKIKMPRTLRKRPRKEGKKQSPYSSEEEGSAEDEDSVRNTDALKNPCLNSTSVNDEQAENQAADQGGSIKAAVSGGEGQQMINGEGQEETCQRVMLSDLSSLSSFEANYSQVLQINNGDTMIDPVRLAIQTIMIIWKERLSGWYGRSLELLLYIHQKHPTIQPLKAKQLMSNIKMKIAVLLFLESNDVEKYKKFVNDNFPGEDCKRERETLLSLEDFATASELVFSKMADVELTDTRISLFYYLWTIAMEITTANE